MSCSNCNNGGSSNCGCSGSSSSCGCGGDCGQPTKIITKQGLTGPIGPQGPAGPTGPTGPQGPAGPGYYFEFSQSIDFLDNFLFNNINATPSNSIGFVTINANANGINKAWNIGTPIKIVPVSNLANPGAVGAGAPMIEGIVSNYVSATGELLINVLAISGTGTYTDWAADLSYQIPTVRYLNGIVLPPTGAGSAHGDINVFGNTIFRAGQCLKINLHGYANANANPIKIVFDGDTLFEKVMTSAELFNLEITLNVGHYVTLSAEYKTASGTDDEIQWLGAGNPPTASYLLDTFKPKFKGTLVFEIEDYGSQPMALYSGTAYRL